MDSRLAENHGARCISEDQGGRVDTSREIFLASTTELGTGFEKPWRETKPGQLKQGAESADGLKQLRS